MFRFIEDSETVERASFALEAIGEPSVDRFMGDVATDADDWGTYGEDTGEGYARVSLTDSERACLAILLAHDLRSHMAQEVSGPFEAEAAIVEWDDRGFHYVEWFDTFADSEAMWERCERASFIAHGPDEGDYVIGANGYVWQHGYTTLAVRATDRDHAEAMIREAMERDQFYPNVWVQDDHGGIEPITLSEPTDSEDEDTLDVYRLSEDGWVQFAILSDTEARELCERATGEVIAVARGEEIRHRSASVTDEQIHRS